MVFNGRGFRDCVMIDVKLKQNSQVFTIRNLMEMDLDVSINIFRACDIASDNWKKFLQYLKQ